MILKEPIPKEKRYEMKLMKIKLYSQRVCIPHHMPLGICAWFPSRPLILKPPEKW